MQSTEHESGDEEPEWCILDPIMHLLLVFISSSCCNSAAGFPYHPTVERTFEYSMSNTAPRNESIPDLEDHLHALLIGQQSAAGRL